MRVSLYFALLFMSVTILGCGGKSVSDFTDNRLQYADKMIEIVGKVSDANRDAGFFKITDGKATMIVMNVRGQEAPQVYTGDEVKVIGRMKLDYNPGYWPWTKPIVIVIDMQEGGILEIVTMNQSARMG